MDALRLLSGRGAPLAASHAERGNDHHHHV